MVSCNFSWYFMRFASYIFYLFIDFLKSTNITPIGTLKTFTPFHSMPPSPEAIVLTVNSNKNDAFASASVNASTTKDSNEEKTVEVEAKIPDDILNLTLSDISSFF